MTKSLFTKAGWAVVVLAALGAAGYAARDNLAALVAEPVVKVLAERPAQAVRVTRVAFVSGNEVETYTGTIRPKHEASLGFRIAGKLVARLVEVGDLVAKGQVVARLDDTDARLELEAAMAEEAAAQTDLARAQADLVRSRELFASGHVAQAALDRATSAAAEAVSRAERAERMRVLAANQLSYTELVADTDGVVTATPTETGQVVAAGQAAVSVARTDALDVVFALPEQSRGILTDAVASAELWEAGGKTYTLTLRDISPDVDPAGRTYRVRMTLTAPDAEATLGRTVTVRLANEGGEPSAPLPLAAVLNDGTGAAVWRLAEGADRVERVPVELAAVDGAVAHVRGDLAEGDIVVSLGAHKLDPDRPVRVVETAATPES
ncbi:efflux RND transporter periplasmic adaptor subunit [Tabrizicola sp.]|uniref:efflux RND transporter periplasmic adaptor subunit n=1 Tax=Tabrizicola sp. TaxID=2005166 RepID=UPI003F39B3C8